MGGILTALGYGKPLVEAVQFANRVAASVVEKKGAQFIADKFTNGNGAFDQW
jgi:sugar/nucleoside kinase (ribokinase family)